MCCTTKQILAFLLQILYFLFCSTLYFLSYFGFNKYLTYTYDNNYFNNISAICVSVLYIPYIHLCFELYFYAPRNNEPSLNDVEIISPCITKIKSSNKFPSLKQLALNKIHILSAVNIYNDNSPNNISAIYYYRVVPKLCTLEIPITLKSDLQQLYYSCPKHFLQKPQPLASNIVTLP